MVSWLTSRRLLALAAVLLLILALGIGAQEISVFTMSSVMTKSEYADSGIGSLSKAQRDALDKWLNHYTIRIVKVSKEQVGGSCTPAIETTIDGEFHGWDGETIFKLSNGQIWQQSEYSYTYSYAYMPSVTIYSTQSGCAMKVEGEDETIHVKRLK